MTGRSYNDTSTKPFVVHIARAGTYSHGNIALRASSALFPTATSQSPDNDTAADAQYSPSVARLRGGMCSTNADVSRGTCSASFVAASAGGAESHLIGHDRVERYLDFDGLEDEITAWDGDSVRAGIADAWRNQAETQARSELCVGWPRKLVSLVLRHARGIRSPCSIFLSMGLSYIPAIPTLQLPVCATFPLKRRVSRECVLW